MNSATAKLPQNPATRFAPSPTGLLHLGHVASAIFVWGLAGRFGASVFLRIEDHDRSRCREAYEQAICTDLAWLGLGSSSDLALRQTPSLYRQSDSLPVYEQAVAKLKKNYQVYGCDCTRQQIAKRQGPGSGELCYDGYCRGRGLALSEPGVGWRVLMPDTEQTFTDLLLGPQRQRPLKQCGDLLLKDRVGQFTYHFAVVVDDLRHGTNLIIRGQDLTAATGRQLWLAKALTGAQGSEPLFHYLHHPLIADASGQKLSKRFFAEGLELRRQRGESPAEVLGEAAYLVGLNPHRAPLKAADLAGLFAPT